MRSLEEKTARKQARHLTLLKRQLQKQNALADRRLLMQEQQRSAMESIGRLIALASAKKAPVTDPKESEERKNDGKSD